MKNIISFQWPLDEEGGEGGDTVFDILAALLQLQYFLVRGTVTKKIVNFVTTSIVREHLKKWVFISKKRALLSSVYEMRLFL